MVDYHHCIPSLETHMHSQTLKGAVRNKTCKMWNCGNARMLCKIQTHLQTAHFFSAPSKLHFRVPSYSTSQMTTSLQLELLERRNAVDPPSRRGPKLNRKIPLSCSQIVRPASSPSAREACCRFAH